MPERLPPIDMFIETHVFYRMMLEEPGVARRLLLKLTHSELRAFDRLLERTRALLVEYLPWPGPDDV